MSRIRDAAEAYANAFPNNERRDLLYQGETGVGKTYLLNCIGGRVLERGYSVLKISAYKLIQLTLDNLRNEPSERPDYILPDLLIVDDLGTEPMIRNITIETLLSIVCERQDLDKATIIATNLAVTDEDGVDTLQSVYGERFASRFMAPRTAKDPASPDAECAFVIVIRFLIFIRTTVEQHKRATQCVCPFSVSYPMCGKAHLYVAYFLALCSAVRCLIFSYSESIFLRCQRRSPANSSKGATYSAAERKSPSTS